MADAAFLISFMARDITLRRHGFNWLPIVFPHRARWECFFVRYSATYGTDLCISGRMLAISRNYQMCKISIFDPLVAGSWDFCLALNVFAARAELV